MKWVTTIRVRGPRKPNRHPTKLASSRKLVPETERLGTMTRHFKDISPKAYEHPADRAATSALHSVPLLDTVIKRLTDLGHERRTRQIVMGNAVLIGERQVPQ